MHRSQSPRLASSLLGFTIGLIAPAALHAQALTVQDQNTAGITPITLAQSLAGTGITISNVTYIGTLESSGQFQGGAGIIGFPSGIILSSGWAVDTIGPNQSDGTSESLGIPGDTDLDALSGFTTHDATVLEFDFVPASSVVGFQYVFGSEEYNEYVNSQFNDVFAFFVNGVNCATVGNPAVPVTINTINNGNPFGTPPISNPQLYRNNDVGDPGPATINTELDGLTVILTCNAVVNAGQVNHMKLAIADASDSILDSYVFLKSQSLVSSNMSVSDGTLTEGGGSMAFTVTRAGTLTQPGTVAYTTANGTATAPSDYTTTSGTLFFPPTLQTRTVLVPIVNDNVDEPDETFQVVLSNPFNAVLLDGDGVGTITDNDPPPAISVGDCAALEGDAGTTPCTFTATLSNPSTFAVGASYTTADVTATQGSDYITASGTLSFAPLATSQTFVSVNVLGDVAVENDETFALNLSAPTNATLGDASGQGAILDDDAPSLSTLELTHGSRHTADLAGGTPDLYRLYQQPLSSYEVEVDASSGDVATGLLLERLAANNTTVLQTGAPVAGGSSRTLRFENPLTLGVASQHIRISAGACGGTCDAEDVYRVRAWDTTLRLARFNNSATQITLVLLQNETTATVTGHMNFWSGSGALLRSQPFTAGPRALVVTNTAALSGLAGQGGTVTVSHDGGYGSLTGKGVSVEPATGFTFDSALQDRPR
jgi:hypothetical protein